MTRRLDPLGTRSSTMGQEIGKKVYRSQKSSVTPIRSQQLDRNPGLHPMITPSLRLNQSACIPDFWKSVFSVDSHGRKPIKMRSYAKKSRLKQNFQATHANNLGCTPINRFSWYSLAV